MSGSRERLAFNFGGGSVPSRQVVEAAIARENAPTFATVPFSEPRDWGYAGLLAFTAVLMTRPQDTLPFLDPFHLAEVCAIIGIAPMVLHRLASSQPVFRVTPETIGLIAFGFVILFTVPFSIWPGGAFGLFTDTYLKLLVVFVLMMNTLTTPKRVEQITWLIVLCCGFIAARSVVDYARGLNLVEGNRLAGPVGGIFGNPNDLAMNMVTFLPSAAVIALSRRFSLPKRSLAALASALMLATVVFTKSRGGFLGLAVVLLTLVFLGKKVRPGFGTMAVVAVLCASPFMPATFWERMASIVDDRKDKEEFTGTREARWTVMKEGIRAFQERPLTGVVPANSRITTRRDARRRGAKRTMRRSRWRRRPASSGSRPSCSWSCGQASRRGRRDGWSEAQAPRGAGPAPRRHVRRRSPRRCKRTPWP